MLDNRGGAPKQDSACLCHCPGYATRQQGMKVTSERSVNSNLFAHHRDSLDPCILLKTANSNPPDETPIFQATCFHVTENKG